MPRSKASASTPVTVETAVELKPLLPLTVDPPTAFCFECGAGPFPAHKHDHIAGKTWFFVCPKCGNGSACSNPWFCWKHQRPQDQSKGDKDTHWCGSKLEIDMKYTVDMAIVETRTCPNPYHTYFTSRVIEMTKEQKEAVGKLG